MSVTNRPNLFAYRIVRDFGFAPNPFGYALTLATCKPAIREAASVGDLVIAFGGSAIGGSRVVAAFVVSEKMTFQEFWTDARFASKKPCNTRGLLHAYGDNIYSKDTRTTAYRQAWSHHSLPDGTENTANLKQDTNTDQVLVASDFVYFGALEYRIPPVLEPVYGSRKAGRGFKSKFPQEVEAAAFDWFAALPVRGIRELPSCWPSNGEGRNGTPEGRPYRWKQLMASPK